MEKKAEVLEFLKKMSCKYNIYLVGAGNFGRIWGQWLNKNNVEWKGYLDSVKIGRLNGKNIYSFFSVKREDDFFVLTSYNYFYEMKKDLLQQGIKEEMIYVTHDTEFWYDILDEIESINKYICKIKQFKKCHLNQKRCFVIGNGPSLSIDDLDRLKKEICLASNGIYAVYKKTKWRPNYYFMTDAVFVDEVTKDKQLCEIIMKGCTAAFTVATQKYFFDKYKNSWPNLYFFRSSPPKLREDIPNFSGDCSQVVYSAATVTYKMLQMAVYMGFSEIYLLGMDFTFSNERHQDYTIESNNVLNHMDVIEEEERKFSNMIKDRGGYSYLADIDMQKKGYLAAKKYADEHGIKIYNATRGGKLEVFERVDFDTLF